MGDARPALSGYCSAELNFAPLLHVGDALGVCATLSVVLLRMRGMERRDDDGDDDNEFVLLSPSSVLMGERVWLSAM